MKIAQKTVVAIGYASLDYPVILDGYFQGDHTVMIKSKSKEAFPRPGGSPRYVARTLASGSDAEINIITWVGSDELGEVFLKCVRNDGVSDRGIAVIESGATPFCLMLYQQDDSCGCCFDPGFMGREVLTAVQLELIGEADLLCVTVGPARLGLQALSIIKEDAGVAWVAKNDPLSFTEELCSALGKRADYIFCNTHERSRIDQALQHRVKAPPLIIETQGVGDVSIRRGDQHASLAIESLNVSDLCGAGDTLAGGSLAAVISGEQTPVRVAQAGIDAAQKMLLQRIESD